MRRSVIKVDIGQWKQMGLFPAGSDGMEILRSACFTGVKIKLNGDPDYIKNRDVYHKRLFFELSIIEQRGFNGIFLALFDIFKFAGDNNALSGPGNGLYPSSLVLFCLGVSDINPIKYNLVFERFIHDLDEKYSELWFYFQNNKKEAVKKYIMNKYRFACNHLDINNVIPSQLNYLLIGDGLRNASECIDRIYKHSGIIINWNDIQEDDANALESVLSDTGQFPFINSQNCRELLEPFKTLTINDLSMVLSLDNGSDSVFSGDISVLISSLNLVSQSVKHHLSDTYNIILFQEQLIHMISEYFGIDHFEANKIRVYFQDNISYAGTIWSNLTKNNCLSKAEAGDFFHRIIHDAPFLRVKSHSLGISILIYRLAWLKYYYPEDYHDVFDHNWLKLISE